MPSPFEVPFADVQANIDGYVDEVFSSLRSEFMAMPKGEGFIDYPVFEAGYEALKRATGGFESVSADAVIACVYETPITFVVLRTMLGFTPPEWAYTTTLRSGVPVDQGAARTIDRKVRLAPFTPMRRRGGVTEQRIEAMVATACQLLVEGVPADTPPELLHRLGKADTASGIVSLRTAAHVGIPYAMLLYERFLGRPFAAHRDSVSELVGDALESAIEGVLSRARVGFHKTRRAERVPGFEQAPDFIIPSWTNPRVIIEAKVTEDDGTARDKVTRIVNLVNLAKEGVAEPRYQVVACLAGRGFAVRREDMKRLLVATKGKVFTLQTVGELVAHTDIAAFASAHPEQPPPDPVDVTLINPPYMDPPPERGGRGG